MPQYLITGCGTAHCTRVNLPRSRCRMTSPLTSLFIESCRQRNQKKFGRNSEKVESCHLFRSSIHCFRNVPNRAKKTKPTFTLRAISARTLRLFGTSARAASLKTSVAPSFVTRTRTPSEQILDSLSAAPRRDTSSQPHTPRDEDKRRWVPVKRRGCARFVPAAIFRAYTPLNRASAYPINTSHINVKPTHHSSQNICFLPLWNRPSYV